MKLSGKTVLITGASSGLGHELALRLARRSCRLIVTARRKERLENLAEQVRAAGGECLVSAADATDPEQVDSVISAALERFGRIDVAVLNAGGGSPINMANATAAEVRHIMKVNYDTFVNFLCPMVDYMRPQGGVIAYTGSPAGYFGLPKSGPYSAAKAAGRVLFDACRIELADTDIEFVALYPGFTYTDALPPESVPIKSLIIQKERAVSEMIAGIEASKSHHMFPKRIKYIMGFGRSLPEGLRRRVLGLFALRAPVPMGLASLSSVRIQKHHRRTAGYRLRLAHELLRAPSRSWGRSFHGRRSGNHRL